MIIVEQQGLAESQRHQSKSAGHNFAAPPQTQYGA